MGCQLLLDQNTVRVIPFTLCSLLLCFSRTRERARVAHRALNPSSWTLFYSHYAALSLLNVILLGFLNQ